MLLTEKDINSLNSSYVEETTVEFWPHFFAILDKIQSVKDVEQIALATSDTALPRLFDQLMKRRREENELIVTVFNHVFLTRPGAWNGMLDDDELDPNSRFQSRRKKVSVLFRFMEVVGLDDPRIWDALENALMHILRGCLFYKENERTVITLLSSVFRAFDRRPNSDALFSKYGPFIVSILEYNHELYESGSTDRTLLRALQHHPVPERNRIIKLLKGTDPWGLVKKNVVHNRYVWSSTCAKSDEERTYEKDMRRLRQFAKVHGIRNANKLMLEDLCSKLDEVAKTLPLDDCDLTDKDPWTQEEVRNIPPYRRYKIDRHCFDIDSLYQALQHGQTRNPLNRDLLDINAISGRYGLVRNTYTTRDKFYQSIRDDPVETRQTSMAQILADIWAHLTYPVAISAFQAATEAQLDDIMVKLSSFGVIPASVVNIADYQRQEGKEAKFGALVNVLQRVFLLPQNENSSTIANAVDYALNDVLRNRRQREEDPSDEVNPSQRRRLEGGTRNGKRKKSSRKTERKRRRSRSRIRIDKRR